MRQFTSSALMVIGGAAMMLALTLDKLNPFFIQVSPGSSEWVFPGSSGPLYRLSRFAGCRLTSVSPI
jgi:hypothetical protein